MQKYLLLLFISLPVSAYQPLTCNSVIENISDKITNIITKMCSLNDFKNSYFILNATNITLDSKTKLENFFIFNQLENLVLMPVTMYKKLLLVYKVSDAINKHDAVEDTEWVYYDQIPTLNNITNNCTYLVQNSISGVESALNSEEHKTSYIQYYIIVATVIAFSSILAGFFARFKIKKQKINNNYNTIT